MALSAVEPAFDRRRAPSQLRRHARDVVQAASPTARIAVTVTSISTSAAGEFVEPARAVGLRQVDPAAPDRRPRRAKRRSRSTGRHDEPRCLAATGAQMLGFVFQEPTLMPWATAERQRHAAARSRQARSCEARPLRVPLPTLERLSDSRAPSAGRYPRELSGGMKMRVSIARALVTQPRRSC